MAFAEFRPLDEKSLVEYIKAVPSLSSKLGSNLDGLIIKEVGDGNLNFVYIVIASSGSLVIKQASFLSSSFSPVYPTWLYDLTYNVSDSI